MSDTFDSTPSAITAQAVAGAFAANELARREAMNLNWEFYYGNQSQFVETINEEAEPIVVNLTKPIVKKRSSLLYQHKLIREVTGPSQSIDALEKVWEDNDFDPFMLKVDRLAEITGSTLVMPRQDDTLPGGIRYITYNGIMISLLGKEDNSNEIEAVSIIRVVDKIIEGDWKKGMPQVQKVIVQQIWTADTVVRYDGGVLATSEPNELGFLPFANFKGEEVDGQAVGFSPTSGTRQLNQAYNQMLSDLGYTVKMQAATPLALEGYQSGEQVTVSPGRAISLPIGAKATVVDFNPKIRETLEVLDHIEEKVYETSSVPKVSVVGGDANSGRELLIKWFPLVEVFEEKSVRFERYETELANVTLKVLGLPPIKHITVKYPGEDNLPLSADDDNLQRDIDLGIKSAVGEIMREDPSLTPRQAEAILKKNLSYRVDTIPVAE